MSKRFHGQRTDVSNALVFGDGPRGRRVRPWKKQGTLGRAAQRLTCGVVAGAVLLGASGCHRATEQDCEQILDRVVELELAKQGVRDPNTVEMRKAQIRKARHDDLMRSCVGRRVSKSALACIRNAKTSEQITEKCLR